MLFKAYQNFMGVYSILLVNSVSELGAVLALTSAYMLRLHKFSLVNRKVNI
jgi:hypothetical protein